jgi:hypothetical protein
MPTVMVFSVNPCPPWQTGAPAADLTDRHCQHYNAAESNAADKDEWGESWRCGRSWEKKEYAVTWVEICKQYPGQWVLIEYQKLDEQLNVVEGEVVAHSSTKEDLYKQLLQTKGKNIAIEYSGELPQDLAVMFAVWPGTS